MSISRQFIRQAQAAPMLTPDEERELAALSRAGDDKAAERLLASHFRFVVAIARNYRSSGVPFADLVQQGMVGLLQAARKFDADTHDNRFATYAMWWIRSAMQDYVVRSWSLVRVGTTNAQKALALALRKAMAEGPGALSEELAARLAARFATSLAEVTALARRLAAPDASLDAEPAGAGSGWHDRLRDPAPTPEEMVAERSEAGHRSRLVAAAMAALSPRERLIIMKRHLSDLAPSLETLAGELELSKERVRVLEKKALAKLRELLAPLAP